MRTIKTYSKRAPCGRWRFSAFTLCSVPCRFIAVVLPTNHLFGHGRPLVALVAKGLTNKEIASRLNLSEFTVRNHIHRILKQLDAETRREAVDVVRASGYMISA